MALLVLIKPRAERQIEKAADRWRKNRPAAPGAIRLDLRGALSVLAEHPGIGTKVENARHVEARRLYLTRIRYFGYYRVKGEHLEVVAFWHERRGTSPGPETRRAAVGWCCDCKPGARRMRGVCR